MKLYIMRHAAAEEGDRMDGSRSLTAYGEWQADVMQQFLKSIDVKVDLVITSDFDRGKETGDYFRPQKARHVELKELRPDRTAEDAWLAIYKTMGWDPTKRGWLEKSSDFDDLHVLIIGHGPQIQALVTAACFAFEPGEKVLAHGNMIKLQTAGEHQFHWLMTPRLAAHMLGIEEDEEPGPELADQGKDPEALAIDEAMALAESLAIPDRRAVIDPLVAKLQKALRMRWRAQLKQLEVQGLPHLSDSIQARTTLPSPAGAPQGEKDKALAAIPMRYKQFAVKFRKAVNAAYDAGVARVQGQLPIPVAANEAPARQQKRQSLPGPTREPEELEAELDQTTKERVGSTIERAFAEGLGYAAMVGLVREQFQSWGEADEGETSRAETVALAEISGAYHDGGRDVALDYTQDVEKLWETEDDPCEECDANAEMDWIPDDAPFDSGDMEPPAHPNCRCSLSYRVAEAEQG